ncbi:uncharacterized protein LOC135099899 [Scylla paramamosain]|uniref:uncharacterized protein LOC135099899 n=1 Tax=Scylla paramamosain TaxID=85552 RepID=UPI003083A540
MAALTARGTSVYTSRVPPSAAPENCDLEVAPAAFRSWRRSMELLAPSLQMATTGGIPPLRLHCIPALQRTIDAKFTLEIHWGGCSLAVPIDEPPLQTPTTPDEWMRVAHGFKTWWNFPNCVEAIDGKHILIRPPPDSGSYFYNYKGSHSIVLMAICDANCEFLYVDIGCNG